MKRVPLALLSIGHLTVDITGGALPALLPFLHAEFRLSYLQLALVIATSNVTSSIVQPVFGLASDIRAARWLLPLGVLLAVIGFGLIGVAPAYAWMLAAVACSGVGSAIYHPEASKCAASVVGDRRATGMAMFSAGGNIGFALGPVMLLAILALGGLRGTWLIALPGGIVALALVAVLPAIARAQNAHALHAAVDVRPSQPRAMRLLVAVVTARSVVYSGILTFVPLYAVNVLHRNPHGNGVLLSMILGAGAVGTIVAGQIADRVGKRTTILVSLACVPLMLTLYLLVPGPLGLAAIVLAGAFLVGTFTPTLLLGQEFMPNRVALASALMIGFTSGLGGVGVALLGRAADVAGLAFALWALVGIAVVAVTLGLGLRAEDTVAESVPVDLRATAR